MNYVSTRGRAAELPFADVLLEGLATDGGLYVPESWPALPAVAADAPYATVATEVMWPFVEGSIDRAAFEGIVAGAYATFARPEVSGAETVQLDSLLRETAALARSALTPSVRLVVQHSPGDPLVRGSWTSLQQVLVNLMVNARDAMPGGGTITVARRIEAVGPRHRWAPPDLPRGRYHMVTVTDTGEGIAPEHVDRIFDPFFTTKGVGRGSGLGLPTALGIARAHGGWLAAETAPGNGTTFRLLLPVLSAA